MKLWKYYLIALGIILIDQASKLAVYFYMEMGTPGEIYVLGDWFRLHYLLNPGMAFGLKSSHEYGKLFLTFFRIGAMFAIAYYLYYLAKRNARSGLLICIALILGGAVGNVIDSTFYGVLLDNAPANVPTPWFHGQVIDMLFFPLFDGFYPNWFPIVGGQYFLFFSPVFNIADSAIFVGVALILIFQQRFFKEEGSDQKSIVEDKNEKPGAEEDNSVVIS
ncbi:MAG: lipoprotein signal peptidase [Candidatus Cyclobacteriaceae bacterium M2_1C_046]